MTFFMPQRRPGNGRALAVSVLTLVLLAALSVAGCARTSPYVGTWTASAMGRTATLTLGENKTGTLSLPIGPAGQQSVKWTEGEQKNTVTLTLATPGAAGRGGAAQNVSVNVTGTLSEDGKTLNVAAGPQTLVFQKQEAK